MTTRAFRPRPREGSTAVPSPPPRQLIEYANFRRDAQILQPAKRREGAPMHNVPGLIGPGSAVLRRRAARTDPRRLPLPQPVLCLRSKYW